MKNVVVLGGGTGTFVVLQSLRDKGYNLSAVLTMVDDGGSNKILRDEFGLLPTSGVRLAMVALSKKPGLLRQLFMYRFHKGNGISGMTFGNLFLAAVTDIVGSQQKAIEQTCELLAVKGKILPISYEDVRLVAQLENDEEIIGEHAIDEPVHDGKLKIKKLFTKPEARISDQAKEAIEQADAIIFGPGDFYTNTVANFIIGGVVDAVLRSKAQVIFVINLMTDYGESYNYKASDYLKDLEKYFPIERINTLIVNSDAKYPTAALEKYKSENSIPVVDDLASLNLPETLKIMRAAIVSKKEAEAEVGDSIRRSIIRHDPKKLGKVLMEVIENNS